MQHVDATEERIEPKSIPVQVYSFVFYPSRITCCIVYCEPPLLCAPLDTSCSPATGEYPPVQESRLKQLPSVKRCVLEAIRLRAPGMITRKVKKTHKLNVSRPAHTKEHYPLY